jgi:hypothetical protein
VACKPRDAVADEMVKCRPRSAISMNFPMAYLLAGNRLRRRQPGFGKKGWPWLDVCYQTKAGNKPLSEVGAAAGHGKGHRACAGAAPFFNHTLNLFFRRQAVALPSQRLVMRIQEDCSHALVAA